MLLQLTLFLIGATLVGLIPVYLGARVLRVGNPSVIGAIIALTAVIALQDMAFRFIEQTDIAWLVSVLAGAFAISLMLDCPYWKAVLICALIALIQTIAVNGLLGGTPLPEHLSTLVNGTQKELWPDYN